ncbi:hypothetical protein CALCODRAFT_479863 [Calocera cornea HHB12733]|uniref:Srp40 C-terminal domain-containing protein n=1 Tax=Calocera cornea HHB12733 TaxID=1353952 RepID=A0A165JAU8_9BASI|nr:hypothetical protein CALCODRAFT_479863 [Calocera cornea HHB12733]
MATNDEETLSLTYTLIYNFLISKGHEKAAKSLRKAAKPVVDVKKASALSEDLVAVVTKWKSDSAGKKEEEDNDDSSDSSDSESDAPAPVKPAPIQAATIPTQPEASSSSSSEEDEPAPPPPPPTKPTKKRKRLSEPAPNGHAAPSTPKPAANGTTAPAATPAADAALPSAPPATEPPAKRARKAADPGAAAEASAEPESSPLKPVRKQNVPFSRIKPEDVSFADERLKDNRFEARGAGGTDYGARANRDLIVTRGAGFRKEKNKKKRGSYVGGEITLQSHSIKFDD